ncbi:hypothetical protein J2T20_003135 [Paenibacillus wynnii]|nr:hypothetical protein [Paenibacillus wynnii]
MLEERKIKIAQLLSLVALEYNTFSYARSSPPLCLIIAKTRNAGISGYPQLI